MADHKIYGNDGAGNVDLIEKSTKRQHFTDVRYVTVRWEPYKPDGARQMKAKGRWQEQVGSGDYFRWQNCDRPEFAHDPETIEDLTAQLDAANARADQARDAALVDVANKRVISAAIYDPGSTQGYKGDRTLTEWQADAVIYTILALRDKPAPAVTVRDSFAGLIADARTEAEKAMKKFPQPNYVLLKVAEEAGEVVKAGVHFAEGRETRENVKSEMIQAIAMLYRLWVEGDQVNGVPPIAPPEA